MIIRPGKYIHFKGNEYEVIGTAAHSETQEQMVVYRALYGEGGLWVRPAEMWSEIVEHNGRRVKRFAHVDDIVSEPELPTGIHKHSKPAQKIALFLSLFAGRNDVYAERWENAQKKISGYAPVCNRKWLPLCPKSGGGKMKCTQCPQQEFARYDEGAVEQHLKENRTVGVYPMFSDETCRFLVFDFDGKGE